MPGCWPSEGVQCLLRDGSQIDMFEGLHRMIVGIHLAGAKHAFVSASSFSSVACCRLYIHNSPVFKGKLSGITV